MKMFLPLLFLAILSPGLLVAAGLAPDQFVIQFPKDANLEGVKVDSQSGGTWQKDAAGSSYVLETKNATAAKAIIFSPHYKTVLIDASSWKGHGKPLIVNLEAAATLPLAGRIVFPDGVDTSRFVLEIRYECVWGMGFFNYVDGPPRGFLVTSAQFNEHGDFKAAVPDFAHDTPVKWSRENDYLWLIVREKKTGNSLYNLVSVPGKEKRPTAIVEDLHIKAKYDRILLHAVERTAQKQ